MPTKRRGIKSAASGGLSASFLLRAFLAATAIKLLLIPGYRSTDFEVHRNWLALTHSLPVSQWYYEATSEWTLDYPPYFAWFEYALSHVARWFDADMLVVANLNYASPATVLFQRLSVMATDITLPIGLWVYFGPGSSALVAKMVAVLVLLNPGLLIVDHMHFQYNGMLFGLLLISLGCFKRGSSLDNSTAWMYAGAATFAALLNFKHIFLYVAPAVFVYLLSAFCCQGSRFHFARFLALGLTVISVFSISLAPFLLHLPQLATRLFPFKRGLCHAYWAPNMWALYSFADRVLLALLPRLGIHVTVPASSTRGLVGDTHFGVLPDILPLHTLLLTVAAQLPFLWRLWRRPSPAALVTTVVHCGFAAFAFGWHVHEKAVLTMSVPLLLVAFESYALSQVAYVLTLVGTYALFPLLIDAADVPVRWGLVAMAGAGMWALAEYRYRHQAHGIGFRVPKLVAAYVCGLAVVEWYVVVGHALLLGEKWPFLPLMAVSVYCALGVIGCWVALARYGEDVSKIVKSE
ncbi:glycosyltransferase family 57 protein [Catenaria anguillulae PL171]|uniref:Alpha-1,3-glucosyltransferase n=1 Tax=Catenaria anguillulae PL171 TaxID=765915 RepID=A0A1Y2HY03_9FUNG|nr:glycosyltransferase family 57 protein [Catenaria anguillulae PL171]